MNPVLLAAVASLLTGGLSSTVTYRIALRSVRTQKEATDDELRERNLDRLIRLRVAFPRWRRELMDYARDLHFQGPNPDRLPRFQEVISDLRHQARQAQQSTLHFDVSCDSLSWQLLDLATEMVACGIQGAYFDEVEFAQCVGDFDQFFERVCGTMRAHLEARDNWKEPIVYAFRTPNIPKGEMQILADEYSAASRSVRDCLRQEHGWWWPGAQQRGGQAEEQVIRVPINRAAFDAAVSGRRTLEIVLRFSTAYWTSWGLNPDQLVRFTHEDDECLARIVRIARYGGLKELMDAEDLTLLAPDSGGGEKLEQQRRFLGPAAEMGAVAVDFIRLETGSPSVDHLTSGQMSGLEAQDLQRDN